MTWNEFQCSEQRIADSLVCVSIINFEMKKKTTTKFVNNVNCYRFFFLIFVNVRFNRALVVEEVTAAEKYNRKMTCKIVSNKKQLTRLVELMEQNMELAKGLCPKGAAHRKWDYIAKDLNTLGPPEREWHKWQRVWTDLKCKIKKKCNIKKKLGTCGPTNKMHVFNDMEETVIRILSLDGCPCSQGAEAESNFEEDTFTPSTCIKSEVESVSNEDVTSYPDDKQLELFDVGNSKEQLQNEEDSYFKGKLNDDGDDNSLFELENVAHAQQKLFENMTEIMDDIRKSMTSIEYYTKKSFEDKKDQMDEILKLKREKLKLYKDNKEKNDRYRRAKLKLEMEKLELEKHKLKGKF